MEPEPSMKDSTLGSGGPWRGFSYAHGCRVLAAGWVRALGDLHDSMDLGSSSAGCRKAPEQ